MINFELLEEYDHDQVVFCSNKETGLRAIIAIHDTTIGPALEVHGGGITKAARMPS